jgi:hypothetical protein
MRAHELLEQAHVALKDRAATRDQEGERSMALAVSIYGAMTGRSLAEIDGWKFMIALKLARAARGQCHLDDWIDLAGYAALAGECQLGAEIAPSIAPDGAIHHAVEAPMPPAIVEMLERSEHDDDDFGLKAGEAYAPEPTASD